jgi:hypothetical protein
MNLNLLWFSPLAIVYIIMWIMAIDDLQEEDGEFGQGWIAVNISVFVVVPTIIGLLKVFP